MRVIVCGAGQVGSTIARHLASEGIDVTVVDLSPDQARRADESYDVRGMVGHAAHPEVLERAGAPEQVEDAEALAVGEHPPQNLAVGAPVFDPVGRQHGIRA